MKKISRMLMVIFIALLMMCGCSGRQDETEIPEENKGAGNDFVENASPSTSALTFYKYDGKKVISYTMFNDAKEQEILDKIQNIDVVEDENWKLSQIKYPVYGLEIGGQDGMTVFGVWSNGYWITQEGKVYQLELDFESIEKGYEWDLEEEFDSVSMLPCVRYLCQKEDEWNKKVMDAAEKLEDSNDISMKVLEVKDALISVEVKNESKMPWEYGEPYSLQVQIDGTWYVVPMIPGNWGFTMPLYVLQAGESMEKSYNIEMYGELPKGTYRIVVENLTAEFEVE